MWELQSKTELPNTPSCEGKKTERYDWKAILVTTNFSCDYTLNQYEFSITPYYVFIHGCSSKPSTNPLHSKISIHFLHTGLSTFHHKKNSFDNQELVKLLIISVILLTFAFDSRLILWGELRSRSLLGSTFLHLSRGQVAIRYNFTHYTSSVQYSPSVYEIQWCWVQTFVFQGAIGPRGSPGPRGAKGEKVRS